MMLPHLPTLPRFPSLLSLPALPCPSLPSLQECLRLAAKGPGGGFDDAYVHRAFSGLDHEMLGVARTLLGSAVGNEEEEEEEAKGG